jgi:ribosomal protein S18 acetylase RimI-like enzyme
MPATLASEPDDAVAVRAATAADLPAVSELLARTWHATYDGIYGPGRVAELTARWHSPGRLAAQLADPVTTILVAEAPGGIVATATVRLEGDVAVLDRLYVAPDAQRSGLGTRLLDACVALHRGAREMRLEVEPRNEGAVRFYSRHGFVVTGATPDCGGMNAGIPAAVMRRPLR